MERAKDVLGKQGEQLAAEHLEAAGLVVLERNWRCREGEVDILARDGSVLVVCEVKTRSSTRFGTPAEAVDFRKSRRLRQLAQIWLAQSGQRFLAVRFDVVAILRLPDGTVELDHLVAVL